MTFSEAVQSALSRSFILEGRARRREFWIFVLFSLLAAVTAYIFDLALGWEGRPWLYFLTSAVLLPASLTVQARRLQDLDWSGRFVAPLAVAMLVDLLLGLQAMLADAWQAYEDWQSDTGFLWFLLILIVLYFIPSAFAGTRGPNRFGADPLGEQI